MRFFLAVLTLALVVVSCSGEEAESSAQSDPQTLVDRASKRYADAISDLERLLDQGEVSLEQLTDLHESSKRDLKAIGEQVQGLNSEQRDEFTSKFLEQAYDCLLYTSDAADDP